MDALQDWNSPRFEDELGYLDRGGVTFEFLRRNARYHDDYRRALEGVASGGPKRLETMERLSKRWGVTFPGRSVSPGSGLTADLASAALSRNRHS